MSEKLHAFARPFIVKSGDAETAFRVGGVLTTEDRDEEGDIIKAVDWNYFTGGFGKIKYEHTEFKGPHAVIGFPDKLIKKGKAHYFEGELIKFDPNAPEDQLTQRQRLAKSTVELIKDIEEYNKRHPGTPQKAGWSLEADVVSKSKNGLIEVKPTNVVFTTQPVNRNTFAQVLKSLDVGYAHGVSDQTGFSASRKSSLEGDEENQNQNFNNKEKKMNSKEEVYKSCRAKGMDHNKALEEANKWEKENDEKKEKSLQSAAVALVGAKESLQKSINSIRELEGIEVDTDIESNRKKIAKSINVEKDEDVDITTFLAQQAEITGKVMEALKSTNERVEKLAKSIESIAEAEMKKVDGDETTLNQVVDINNAVRSLRGGLASLTQIIAKSKGSGLTTDQLGEFQINESGKLEGKEPKTYSEKMEVLKSLRTEDKITDLDIMNFEASQHLNPNGVIAPRIEKIYKAKVAEIYK